LASFWANGIKNLQIEGGKHFQARDRRLCTGQSVVPHNGFFGVVAVNLPVWAGT
jgi:hypothetical protein